MSYAARRKPLDLDSDSGLPPELQSIRLASKQKVADALDLSLRTIETFIADGVLPAVRIGRTVRIPVSAVRALVAGDSHVERPR